MATITIKNVGPIKNIENLELNKVNIFMGPQSSGKSTIAKIISYFTWAEKRLMLDNMFGYSPDDLINFHRFDNNYFNDDSFIKYENDFVHLCLKGKYLNTKEDDSKKEIKNILDYKKTKNIYIPAERNFVSVVPNLKKYNETNDNVLCFIYDWFSAKRVYTKWNSLPILNFDIKYYYNEESDTDRLILKDGKEIALRTASSGLQSITPLFVIVEHLTNNIFKGKSPVSVMEKDSLEEFIKLESHRRTETEIKTLINNRTFYHSSNFIIEEPEQNLFPSTQKELIYNLLNSLNLDRGDRITITTHSPYILYALNNCMLGHLVKEKMLQDEDYKDLKSLKSSIDPTNVSAWEITDKGTINRIQGEDYLIEGNYFDACMKDVMDDFYKMINYYGDEKED